MKSLKEKLVSPRREYILFLIVLGGSEGCSPTSEHSPTLLDAPTVSSDPSDDHLPSAGIIPEVRAGIVGFFSYKILTQPLTTSTTGMTNYEFMMIGAGVLKSSFAVDCVRGPTSFRFACGVWLVDGLTDDNSRD